MPPSDILRPRNPQEIEREMSLETNLQRMIHLAQELLRALDSQGSKGAGDAFRLKAPEQVVVEAKAALQIASEVREIAQRN